MRFVALFFVLLSASAAAGEGRPEKLMSEIEANLTLPEGALPLVKYARYYTEYRGRIHGAYTTEVEVRPKDYSCSEMQAGFSLKEVRCAAIANLQPGQRRWVPFRDYPAVAAKECHAVQIMYNPADRSFEYVECATPRH
jgi:hypothetical protein